MTVRHAVLGIAAVATLGLGIYLFLAVKATPSASALPAHGEHSNAPADEHHAEPAPIAEKTPHPVEPPPVRSAVKLEQPARTDTADQAPSLPSAPPAIDVKKDDLMAEANKAYDGGDLDEAMAIAKKVLEDDPQNVRMRRVMVSSSCILGDPATAQKNYLFLPPPDRETMRIRCARYGVTFTES